MPDTTDSRTGSSDGGRNGLSPVEIVRGLGGRAERAAVLRRTSQHHLQLAVAAGRLVRPGRGVETWLLPTPTGT